VNTKKMQTIYKIMKRDDGRLKMSRVYSDLIEHQTHSGSSCCELLSHWRAGRSISNDQSGIK